MPLLKRTTDDLNHLIKQVLKEMMHQSIQLCIVVEPRYKNQAQPTGLTRSLEMQGFPVTVVEPPNVRGRLCQDTQHPNLAIVRGRSRELLALVSKLEAQGSRTINRSDAISSVLNKAKMAAALEKSGIPTPATFYEPVQALAMRLPQSTYPLILKPVFGDNARGLRIVSSAEELAAL